MTTRDTPLVCLTVTIISLGGEGWSSGDRARLQPMWPGFKSWTQCHKWVEFFVVSRPCPEGSSPGSPVLRPQSSSNQPFQIPIRSGIRGTRVCQSYD